VDLFQNIIILTILFLQKGKINVAGMTDVPLRVRSHILATPGSKENKAWEYNIADRIIIVDLHKLLAPNDYVDEEQMSSILTHIHLGVVDHLIIHAYVESCTRDAFTGRSVTLYHPIDIGCFPELDDLVHNPPPEAWITCKLHGDLDEGNE
jgi:hypothetical protein